MTSATYDFEQAWQAKLARGLRERAGEEIQRTVMAGAAELTSESEREAVISWTKEVMERLDELISDADTRQMIMTGCACQYPASALADVRQRYEETGSIDVAHQALQRQFEGLLRDTLGLDEDMVQEIVDRGWGSAGVRQGNEIIATKIPKSGNLIEYMRESDPERRRQLYCHCPRVRETLATGESISPTYCYCGAGFYQSIWEGILGRPVQVMLLKSVLQGDDVCTVAVRLPEGC